MPRHLGRCQFGELQSGERQLGTTAGSRGAATGSLASSLVRTVLSQFTSDTRTALQASHIGNDCFVNRPDFVASGTVVTSPSNSGSGMDGKTSLSCGQLGEDLLSLYCPGFLWISDKT